MDVAQKSAGVEEVWHDGRADAVASSMSGCAVLMCQQTVT